MTSEIPLDERQRLASPAFDTSPCGSGHWGAAPSRTESCTECYFDFKHSQNRFRDPSSEQYASYTKGNAYPPSKDESTYKSTVAEANSQISWISDRITRMQRQIALLEEEKVRLIDTVGKYQQMLRPINKLPPEILAKIFLICVKGNPVFRKSTSPAQLSSSLDPSKPPWVQSHVCQKWRNVVTSTSSLWTLVLLPISYPGGANATKLLHSRCFRLKLQLKRCGDLPIQVVTSTVHPDSPAVGRFLDPLCFHSPNWKTLRIELDGQNFLPWMSDVIGRIPRLCFLSIKFVGPMLLDFDCFRYAPKLISLVFTADPRTLSTEPSFNPGRLKLPYKQVRNFRWEDEDAVQTDGANHNTISLGFIRRTLSLLSGLEYCSISLRSKSIQSTPISMDVVTYHHLTYLKLVDVDQRSGIHAILPWMEAPALDHLTISSSGPDETTLSRDALYILLARLPSLNVLSFGVVGGITDEYLLLFRPTEPNEGESILPNLEELSLIPLADFDSTYSDDTLVTILEARWRAGAQTPNTTGCLVFVGLDRPVESERLDVLRIEGLQVEMWGPGDGY
ncbi:hypothetical protein PQX77_022409 [Marasmius sp. AFHP31]|nr:hypothetical protein PQX77_022409 [Marasmius sp. AFHP31]